jgi:hypothetical protein
MLHQRLGRLLIVEELAAVAHQLYEVAVAMEAGRQMAPLDQQSPLSLGIARIETA